MTTTYPLGDLTRRVEAYRALPPPGVCRAIREAAGVSMRMLARDLGVSPSALSSWERGDPRRRPTAAHAKQWAQAIAIMAGDPS
jgi:DNA-binding transcriptional regulator YiaG